MKFEHVFLAALALTSFSATRAFADPAGAPARPCLGMAVTPFGADVPANATRAIKLTVNGGGPFDEYEMPEVLRAEDDGSYVAVPFRLTADSDNPLYARTLELMEPRFGEHIVTWGEGDCGGMVSPVDETKFIVGQFVVREEAALPTELGEYISVDTTPDGGPSPQWIAMFEVELDDAVEPWQEVMAFGVELDHVLVEPFRVGEATDGRLSQEFIYWCNGSLQPGVHEAVVVGRVEGVEVRTEPVEVEIECLKSNNVGCATASAANGTWLSVLVMLGLIGLRRRRAAE